MSEMPELKVCSKCKRKLPPAEFYKDKRTKSGLTCWCQQCSLFRSRSYGDENRDKVAAVRRRTARRRLLKSVYGISEAQYESLLLVCGGVCEACGKPDEYGNKLCVDHCHKTDAIRGILCRKCNVALGLVGDDQETLKRMIAYLSESEQS